MADRRQLLMTGDNLNPVQVPQTLKDLNDGTFAPQVAVTNPVTTVVTTPPTHKVTRTLSQTGAVLVANNHKVLHGHRIIATSTAGAIVHYLDQASATTPSIANVVYTEIVPTGGSVIMDNLDISFTNGIVVVPSTSPTAITAPTSANAPSIQVLSRLA